MIKMENKYKIIVSYIQDLSIEIPSPESLLTIRNTIPEFQVKVDINSKPLKKKMIEVATTLSYANPNKKKETGFLKKLWKLLMRNSKIKLVLLQHMIFHI